MSDLDCALAEREAMQTIVKSSIFMTTSYVSETNERKDILPKLLKQRQYVNNAVEIHRVTCSSGLAINR